MDLFWSKRGIVACATHAPALDSDEWRTQGWQRVPGWRAGVKAKVLQCQFCHGKPYVHHVREHKVGNDDDVEPRGVLPAAGAVNPGF